MSREIGQIRDRLYGRIPYTTNEMRLFQTKEMARMREVSLSAVPTWGLPFGVNASKFEHSVGVGYLAKIVGQKPEFAEIAHDLYFAGLGHDLGTPPFSHTSEVFQVYLLGHNHEEAIDHILEGDSEYGVEVKKQGGDLELIAEFIKGGKVFGSDIINGSIDVDNLDNTVRYALSGGLIREIKYSPEALAKAYAMDGGSLVLKGQILDDLAGWEKCRIDTYTEVYGQENLVASAMIWQAMYLAVQQDEIGSAFFSLTDAQAKDYLATDCNSRTQKLVDDLWSWRFYNQALMYRTETPNQKLVELTADRMNRGRLAAVISQGLDTDPKNVAVYLGKDRGFKQIHLPIIDGSNRTMHQPINRPSWSLRVYVNPGINSRRSQVQIREMLTDYVS